MATLLEVRRKFVELSGRYDLASPVGDWSTDTGADWFINSGLRWLDLQQETLIDMKEWQQDFAIGDYSVDLQNLRAVREVWFTTALGSKVELKKRDMDWLMETYPKLGSTDQGTPAYWVPFVTQRAPAQAAAGKLPSITSSIYVMVPTDAAITVHVWGRFHEKQMEDNQDVNYWSLNYEDILVMAGLRSLEGAYRNTTGVRDYENFIATTLRGIDKDVAEQAMPENEDMVMRG